MCGSDGKTPCRGYSRPDAAGPPRNIVAVLLHPNPLREAHINKHAIQAAHRAAVAANLKLIADAVSDAPDFDTARVNAARQALARGTYEIDVERIAENLIRYDASQRDAGRHRRG